VPDSCDPAKNRSSANKKAAANSRGSRMTAGCCPVAAARKSARCWNYSGGCRSSWALKTAMERCCFADRRLPRVDDRYKFEPSSGLARCLNDSSRNLVGDDR